MTIVKKNLQALKKSTIFSNLLSGNLIKMFSIQTDWGGEYHRLNAFVQKIGISHHISCHQAHQNNASIECKHHHNVDFGLTLLARASMALKFWHEAFLTDIYFIKRMPRKVINSLTPSSHMEVCIHRPLPLIPCLTWHNFSMNN